MNSESTSILRTFYEKLQNNLFRDKIKLKNNSVLWTLIEIKKNKEEYLANSSFSTAHFSSEKLNELLKEGLIRQINCLSQNDEFVLTAHGIWEIEKKIKDFSEASLLTFIQNKYMPFNDQQKPLNDKEKVVIFSLLCIRIFSSSVAMDLTSQKNREDWLRIFNTIFNFLLTNNFLIESKYDSFEKIKPIKGSEHAIQSLMRHQQPLKDKTANIFKFKGNYNYYLDLTENDVLNEAKLKIAFKLVFQNISDLSSFKVITDFCISTANNMAKYVVSDYRFIDSTNDEIIKKIIKEIYIGS